MGNNNATNTGQDNTQIQRSIKIPIHVYNNGVAQTPFWISVSYETSTKIENVLSAATEEVNQRSHPKFGTIKTITNKSFFTRTGHLHSWSTEYEQICSKSLIEFNKNNVETIGVTLCVVFDQKYLHKAGYDGIMCEFVKEEKDPLKCPIYKSTVTRTELKEEYLNHLTECVHFDDEFTEKTECKYFGNCKSYIRLQNGGNRLDDKAHVELYRHPPRCQRNIIFSEQMHQFAFIIDPNVICPLYTPTNSDEKMYGYSDENGYLNALTKEIYTNGFREDLCLVCGNDDECKHKEFSILKIVDDKFDHIRHKQMGRPLRKDHILALVLYTGCDCNYDLCASQRNGNYHKWKWFDLILHQAISKLSKHETASYKVYAGLQSVKMAQQYVEEGFFKTYVSTSWTKKVAIAFMGSSNGMIMELDAKFRRNSTCCDASWISKFADECEVLFARNAPHSVGFQAEIVDDVNDIQYVKMTHSSNQIKRYHDVLKQSYEQMKVNKTKTNTIMPNCVPPPITDANRVIVPVNIQCIGDSDSSKYSTEFKVTAAYSPQYPLQHLIDTSISYLHKKFNPVMFELHSVVNAFGTDTMELSQSLQCPLHDFEKQEVVTKGICLSVMVKIYHHKVLQQHIIECPAMIAESTDDPTYCAIYAKMRYQYEFTQQNLTHMQRYNHFVIDYDDKIKCRYGDGCRNYKRLQDGSNRIEDQCHMIVFVHPPRRRQCAAVDGVSFFEVNQGVTMNVPLYSPTERDEVKYFYNEHDGFLSALIDEIIRNGLQHELGGCTADGEYKLMEAVDKKRSIHRHKNIGSPLNRSEMLAIIAYTGTECYTQMTRCQRWKDFETWKWFDYCLYNAIKKLGMREWGSYTLYTGMNAVKLKHNTVKNTFFKTYTSSSWIKAIAITFSDGDEKTPEEKRRKGMIMEIHESFRESFGSICCDVSWISKFPGEYEVLVARGIDDTSNNFDMEVIDEKDGKQIVLLTKSGYKCDEHNLNEEQKRETEEALSFYITETMKELKNSRNTSQQQNDDHMVYYCEQLMFDEICREIEIKRTNANIEILKDILNNWKTQQQMENFRNFIIESAVKCIKNDSHKVLNVVLDNCGHVDAHSDQRNQEILVKHESARST